MRSYAGGSATRPTSSKCMKVRINRYVWSLADNWFIPASVNSSTSVVAAEMLP
jgi:hypothetical protein